VLRSAAAMSPLFCFGGWMIDSLRVAKTANFHNLKRSLPRWMNSSAESVPGGRQLHKTYSATAASRWGLSLVGDLLYVRARANVLV
jgi:hypothetical protein